MIKIALENIDIVILFMNFMFLFDPNLTIDTHDN